MHPLLIRGMGTGCTGRRGPSRCVFLCANDSSETDDFLLCKFQIANRKAAGVWLLIR